MESNNKLAVLDRKMPLRAFPEQDLNRAILIDFIPYLTRLLSLTDEVSANRLEVALPAIKEQCWGMGFVEIKKMFEMYVDNKLSIQPIPNYFDRILFGKIVKSYQQQKPKNTMKIEEQKLSNDEKENIMINTCNRIFIQFKENGEITDACNHVYDYLFNLDKLPTDELYKKAIFAKATLRAKSEASTKAGQSLEFHRGLKKTLESIDNGNKKSEIISISKKLVLEEYFSKIDKLLI